MNKKYLLILILIPVSLILVWFRNGNMLGGGESALPFYNASYNLYLSAFAWVDYNVGSPNLNQTMAWPFFFLLDKIISVLGNVFAQASFFLFIIVLSLFSIYFLIKEFFPTSTYQSRLLASIFYLFNFITLVNVWNRFLYNHFILWSFLPLSLLFFRLGLRKKEYRFAVLTALLTTIFAFIFTSPAYMILILSLFFYTTLFSLSLEKERIGFGIKYLLLTLVVFFFVNLWWIGGLFSFISSPKYSNPLSAFFTPDNLSTLSTLSSRLGELNFTLRLMHAPFFNDGPFWSGIYTFPFFVILEFAISAITFFTIVKFRKVYSVLFFGILFLITLFLIKGNQPPFGELFQLFFLKISVLQVYRNPFEKFGFLLPLTIAPLLCVGLDYLTSNFKKRKTFIFYLTLLITFWGTPFLTGLVFTRTNPSDNSKLENYEVKIPEYYKITNDWFKTRNINDRLIVLPIGGEGITYTWEKPYSGVELSGTLIDLSSISLNVNIPYYSNLVSELSKYQIGEQIFSFIPFTASRYIIWRGDINYKERKMPNPDVTKQKLEEWKDKGLLEKKLDLDKIAVYEINDKFVWPKIFMASKIIASNENDLAQITKFVPVTERKMAILNFDYLDESSLSNKEKIIKPTKVFSSEFFVPNLRPFSDQDLMARLFYSKYLPTDRLYYLSRIKEVLQTPPKSDYFGWILYKTGLLGKRAVEVYRLHIIHAPEKIIKDTESNYINDIKKLALDINSITSTNNPVSAVVRDSMLYQWMLLKRFDSNASQFLSEFLLDLKLKPQFDLPPSEEASFGIFYHFNVPTPERFKIVQDSVEGTFFLDGKLLDLQLIKDREGIYLNKGSHEVAVVEKEIGLKKIIEGKVGFKVSNLSKFFQRIDLELLPALYRIEFDYLFKKGIAFNINFIQDIDKDNNPIYSAKIVKSEIDHDWQHFSTTITPTPGATYGALKIAKSEEECIKKWHETNPCKDKNKTLEVEIRNFRMTKFDSPPLYLTSEGKDMINPESNLEWQKINPTEYKIKLKKENDYPEILVFSELFNPNWSLEFSKSKLPNNFHYLTNVYANGWLIDKKGDYELILKFNPQNILEAGRIISFVSIIFSVIFLIFSTLKKKHQS